jgi:hypothetical protein
MTKFKSRSDEGYKDFLAELARWLEEYGTHATAPEPRRIPNLALRVQDGHSSTPENQDRQAASRSPQSRALEPPSALLSPPPPTFLQYTENASTSSLATSSSNTDDSLHNAMIYAPSLAETEM